MILSRLLAVALLIPACATLRDGGRRREPVPFVYVGGYDDHISVFRFDFETGSLLPAGTASAGRNPSFLAWDGEGKNLYAVNEEGDGRVLAFAIDPVTGGLTRIGATSSKGVGPAHLSVDGTGRFVLVANYAEGNDGTVAVLPITAGGALGAAVSTRGFGMNSHPHFITTDPGHRFVFVPCLGANFVAAMKLDTATGVLLPHQPDHVASAPEAGPRHMAFHPSGKFAYVINELNSTMTAYRYDGARGTLEPIHTASTLPPDFAGQNSGADVHVHPSGRFLYGSNRGHDSVAVFSLDAQTGRMTLSGHQTETIQTPRNFHIDPTGRLMLVANQGADTISVFRIDPNDGHLTLAADPTPTALTRPSFVGVITRPGR